MKQEIKDKWLAALRSGEYQQGYHRLRNTEDNTFCCLGVLCDLYSKEKGVEWKDAHNFMGSEDYLPLEVVEWAELPDENPWIFIKTDTRGEKETTLVDVNDEGYTFTEIADIIEARL